MANEKKKQSERWSGDEVQRSPGAEAEQAAERAEGNGEISVAEAVRPEGDTGEEPAEESRARRSPDDDPDAKIAAAAEEHRDRLARGDGPPRRTL